VYKQVAELTPIASRGPRLGGSTHGYTSWVAPNTGECRYVRKAPPRPTETLPMLAETNTSHTDKTPWKNLAGAPTLLQGFAGYTRGCASAPPTEQHGNQEGRRSHQQASASAGS
jgi:hypothetical protein